MNFFIKERDLSGNGLDKSLWIWSEEDGWVAEVHNTYAGDRLVGLANAGFTVGKILNKIHDNFKKEKHDDK